MSTGTSEGHPTDISERIAESRLSRGLQGTGQFSAGALSAWLTYKYGLHHPEIMWDACAAGTGMAILDARFGLERGAAQYQQEVLAFHSGNAVSKSKHTRPVHHPRSLAVVASLSCPLAGVLLGLTEATSSDQQEVSMPFLICAVVLLASLAVASTRVAEQAGQATTIEPRLHALIHF